jgi:hypothetical protein
MSSGIACHLQTMQPMRTRPLSHIVIDDKDPADTEWWRLGGGDSEWDQVPQDNAFPVRGRTIAHDLHESALTHYNFCRVYSSLYMTPARRELHGQHTFSR